MKHKEYNTETKLLTPAQTADHLQINTNTLRQWRWKRVGPAFVKIGALVRYRQIDLDTYIQDNITATGEFV